MIIIGLLLFVLVLAVTIVNGDPHLFLQACGCFILGLSIAFIALLFLALLAA